MEIKKTGGGGGTAPKHEIPSQALSLNSPHCLPKCWLPAPPSPWGLREYSAAPILVSVSNQEGQETKFFSSLWWVGMLGELGAWRTFLQLLGTGSQGILCVPGFPVTHEILCVPGFPGTHEICVSLVFLGPTSR